MSFLYEEHINSNSPSFRHELFFPAGSLNSALDSIIEEYPSKSIGENTPNEELTSIQYQMITYESLYTTLYQTKETQTDNNDNSNQDKLKIIELNKTISELKSECKKYVKQNVELREEIKATNLEFENEKISGLKEEIKRLKGRIRIHENMVEKLIYISEDICGDSFDSSKKAVKIDFHAYNYLISKLEILRSRTKRYISKIQKLESDKISMSELLNFYISAAKILETQNPLQHYQSSLTPDCTNPAFTSRKSSELMENSSKTLRATPYDDQNDSKKPLSSGSENYDIKDQNLHNTITNLKGISKLTRSHTAIKKAKIATCCNISPFVPKPRKINIKPNCNKENTKDSNKENIKENTIKLAKKSTEDLKKKRNRCKS
ncbi:hypothetical protein SteCoe_19353 [Stentor coeruleus]|uniref:Uncharacterized protein n=1 Tax=Stentor coeruleus TaxID=5963 RepID=A0A1R2BUG3_9CILI|nr:hypothetical protein SteCoe_19353 [Stentor coeruleus]